MIQKNETVTMLHLKLKIPHTICKITILFLSLFLFLFLKRVINLL